ncbi:MAG: type II toxin-antitoxin system ParD family antitoxin [Gammaproteobacteria bacterium]|nr:type II toxin-antitoxin system ParD family antitoxin [Gammaproteobacteria bacterium]MDE0507019.1 type II toxin-antitoxin system ParD family antitoxin [Gammaproteobacteria bacterium]
MKKGDKQEENELARQRNESEQAFKLLQNAIDQGIASGEPQPFDFDEFKSRMQKKYARSSLVGSASDD